MMAACYQLAVRPSLYQGRPATPIVPFERVRGEHLFPAKPTPAPDLIPPERPVEDTPQDPKIRLLIEIVGEVSGVSFTDIVSDRREKSNVRARQIVMWLAKRFTTKSYPCIGKLIGGRDHTTILHGYRRVQRIVDVMDKPALDTPRAWAEAIWLADWSAS